MKYVSLPEGLTSDQFDVAISEFKKVLGPENVFVDKKELIKFVSFIISENIEDHMPSAALFPGEVEEVVQIVRICNKHKVPIWTCSTGRNIGYGGMAPVKSGTAVLSLRRMNKILEINPELCYAVVEPGVTYKQLYDHIREKRYRLWLNIPTGPTPIAGPVGTTLDRGVGYTPYGESFAHQCGMEVILTDGEILRTGMGGIPNSTIWHVFRCGYGPYLDGIFSQSNYGICIKMGIWLMPEPPAYRPFAITFPKQDDLVELVDTLRPLRIADVIPNTCSIAPGDDSEEYMGEWNIYAALYGTPEQIEVNWNIVKTAFSNKKGVQFYTENELGDNRTFQIRSNLMKGKVPTTSYSKWGPSNWFSPILPAQGMHALKQKTLATEIINKHGFEYYAEFIVGTRDMHHIMEIPFNRKDREEIKRARECYLALLQEFVKNGYGVYRTSIAFMDVVGKTYGPAIQGVFKKIKKALDPNGVLSPGKSGIDI
jgi:4-cresol dehydrogenase (hydroxylating)